MITVISNVTISSKKKSIFFTEWVHGVVRWSCWSGLSKDDV